MRMYKRKRKKWGRKHVHYHQHVLICVNERPGFWTSVMNIIKKIKKGK